MWRESMSLADSEKASRDRIIEDYKQVIRLSWSQFCYIFILSSFSPLWLFN